MRRAKIVCTLGPASSTAERIGELIDAGMDVARLNFSHGNHQSHAQLLQVIRKEAERRGRPVAVLLDLQGPKIRVGKFKDGAVELKQGQEFTITTDPNVVGDERRVSTTYTGLPHDVKIGDQILLDDGLIALRVEERNGRNITCSVINGGLLKEKKGINLPGVAISEPSLTAKDKKDLNFGLELGVDFVALSFVRSAKDIIELKRLIARKGYSTPVIAKIEKIEAIRELDAVIEAADVLMVARGDLGVELPSYEVPLLQKRIIKRCNEMGKPVITATQMLESMIHNPRPTRAESSDVANAVFDGTDVVMLSAETSVGAYPVETVMTMNDILRASETAVQYGLGPHEIEFESEIQQTEYSVAVTACVLAQQVGAQAILCLTYTGNTARVMSRHRPDAPIIAMVSGSEALCRQLTLYRGIYSVLIGQPENTEQAISLMKAAALDAGVVEEGDQVVITTGYPLDEKASTNMVFVDRV
jgi:pyruvate kinase